MNETRASRAQTSCTLATTSTLHPTTAHGSRYMQRPWENPPVPLPPSSNPRETEEEDNSSDEEADLPPPQVSSLGPLRGTGSARPAASCSGQLSRLEGRQRMGSLGDLQSASQTKRLKSSKWWLARIQQSGQQPIYSEISRLTLPFPPPSQFFEVAQAMLPGTARRRLYAAWDKSRGIGGGGDDGFETRMQGELLCSPWSRPSAHATLARASPRIQLPWASSSTIKLSPRLGKLNLVQLLVPLWR